MRAAPEPAEPPLEFDPADYVGVYKRASTTLEIVERDGALVLVETLNGALAELAGHEPVETPLRTFQPGVFVTQQPDSETWLTALFYELADGSGYLHYHARATPKVA